VPLVGRVRAGPLSAAVENVEGYVRLPTTFLRPPSGTFFLLRIHGDSMNRAEVDRERIEDGDLVLVKQQSVADSGQIIVALVDGEATVKQIQYAPGYLMLKPKSSNRAHQPIVVDLDFDVLGTVQKVLKKGSELLDLVEE
jgi:repressor LexA